MTSLVQLLEADLPPTQPHQRGSCYKLANTAAKHATIVFILTASLSVSSMQLAQEGKKIHVVVPDLGEYSRSYKM